MGIVDLSGDTSSASMSMMVMVQMIMLMMIIDNTGDDVDGKVKWKVKVG